MRSLVCLLFVVCSHLELIFDVRNHGKSAQNSPGMRSLGPSAGTQRSGWNELCWGCTALAPQDGGRQLGLAARHLVISCQRAAAPLPILLSSPLPGAKSTGHTTPSHQPQRGPACGLDWPCPPGRLEAKPLPSRPCPSLSKDGHLRLAPGRLCLFRALPH